MISFSRFSLVSLFFLSFIHISSLYLFLGIYFTSYVCIYSSYFSLSFVLSFFSLISHVFSQSLFRALSPTIHKYLSQIILVALFLIGREALLCKNSACSLVVIACFERNRPSDWSMKIISGAFQGSYIMNEHEMWTLSQ